MYINNDSTKMVSSMTTCPLLLLNTSLKSSLVISERRRKERFMGEYRQFCLASLAGEGVEGASHRVHTEWQRPLSGVHSIRMVRVGGACPHPLLYLPSVAVYS